MKVLCALIYCGACPSFMFAAPGDAGFDFLQLTDGPRQAAMAGTGIAVADDVGNASANPAALGRIRRSEVSFTGMRYVESGSYGGLRIAESLKSGGALGLEVHSFDFGGFDTFDGSGSRTGSAKAGDLLYSLGYGRSFGPSFFAGGRVGRITEKIADRSGSTWTADAGALYVPYVDGWLSHTRFGVAAKNIGPGAAFQSEKTSLPRTLGAGAACQLFSEALTAAADLEKPSVGSAVLSLGGELWVNRGLALRAGWLQSKDFSNGFRVGFGMRFGDFGLDYSLQTDNGGFGDVHRIGVSFRFGGREEALYQEGVRLLQEGRVGEAILKFNEVLEINPTHRRAVERLREAALKLKEESSKDAPH